MHVLIIGMTSSGKTSLAKKMIADYRAKKIRSIVLDPLNDPSWDADFITDDNDEFLKIAFGKETRNCALFVDESGAAIGRYAGAMAKVATQSRHLGHKAHFITQRAAQLDRTVRDQCSVLYVFRVGNMDAKILAEEFGFDDLKEANKLERGECFKVSRFSPPEKFKIF